jgi:hypothetical protein
MKTFLCSALFFAVAGCTSITADEPSACDTQSISWTIPALPSNQPSSNMIYTTPELSTTNVFNFSTVFSKFSDVANDLTASITEFVIDDKNGELTWANGIDVMIQGQASDTPKIILASSESNVAGHLNMDVKISNKDALHYIQSGSLTITTILAASKVSSTTMSMLLNLNGTIAASTTMCAGVSGKFSKSL